MRVSIRVPRHPLALQSVMGGLDSLSRPSFDESRDGRAWWLRFNVANNPTALNEALELLTRLNVITMREWIARGGHVPSVYELATTTGFRYKPEPKGREWWQTWADNVIEREGDCEDLATHQAGYYRVVGGIPARAVTKKTGKRVYHAVVEHAGGAIEDPSLPLGLAEWRLRNARRRRARSRP